MRIDDLGSDCNDFADTAAAVLINLLLDMAYHAIDPRIVYG